MSLCVTQSENKKSDDKENIEMALVAKIHTHSGETYTFAQEFVDPDAWTEEHELAKATNSRQYNNFAGEIGSLFQPREVVLVDEVAGTEETPAVAGVTVLAGDAFRALSMFRGVDTAGVEQFIPAVTISRVELVTED